MKTTIRKHFLNEPSYVVRELFLRMFINVLINNYLRHTLRIICFICI